MSLYIFDVGGTLVKSQRSRVGIPASPKKPRDVTLLPGVFEKFAELRAAGHRIALATNQNNVAKGKMTLRDAEVLVESAAVKAGGVDAWRLSPYDPSAPKRMDGKLNPYARDDDSRKPHPGMILDLMKELHFKPEETYLVGNSQDDRKAAKAAGVFYISANKFFKEEK